MRFFQSLKRWQIATLIGIVIAAVLAGAFLLGGTDEPEQKSLAAQSQTTGPQSTESSEAPPEVTVPPTAAPTVSEPLSSETELPSETSEPTNATVSSAFATEPDPKPSTPAATETPTEPATEPPTAAPTEPAAPSCTVSISCASVLNHLDELSDGKRSLIPSDGILLGAVEIPLAEGETAFDILKRVTEKYGIQMEFSTTPLYNTAYIEGIGNLYEKDCGSKSGWMYSVNGVFPNYAVSDYVLQDGDIVRWLYTCDLGADIGGAAG